MTSVLRNDTSKISVTVSPRGNPELRVINKEKITTVNESPAEVLIHELVGHAIPIAESWNGNAVQKENEVRGQVKLKLREAEENHPCY